MNSYQDLLSRIRIVRRRWRTQMVIQGLSLFLASAIALLVLGVWGADIFGFKPAAIWTMRTITGAAVLFIAGWFLYLPLRRRVSDVQIAQYVEERYPELEDRLVTAVEYGATTSISPGMLDLLIRDALRKSGRVDFSVFTNHRRIFSYGVLGAGAMAVLLALLNWGPSFFPYGFNRLYVNWVEAADKSPFLIQVRPGSSELTKGSDLEIRAELVGFDSPDVQLFIQPENTTDWTPAAMEAEALGSDFVYLLVDIQESMLYYAEAAGVRSKTFTITAVDLPSVEQIDLTYNFPPYTGMDPQTVEDEGDISALEGTRVDLRVRLTKPAAEARLIFDDGSRLELEHLQGMEYAGGISLNRSGSYQVQLATAGEDPYEGSREYDMEAIVDEPPTVIITKPQRDLQATNVEEVFSEISSEDDIGIGKVDLKFSINGGEERTVPLFKGASKQSAIISTHTFFLEEFGLEPGDLVSYYGNASDSNNVSGPGEASSDIYFIQVRPFEKNYIQSQQGAPGGGGGGNGAGEALSKQQKEIISATFKLIRDREKMVEKEYVDSLKSLALVQSRLQEQAHGLVNRLMRRGAIEIGDDFGKLAEYLQTAVEEMEKAALHLGERKAAVALPEEQKALQQLMRAESLFREIQISFGQQGGGGGGGSQADAEDLADLFELELNKLKNQYETVQRGERQMQDQQMDEATQRLKELAQRQQQLNERNRMMGQRGNRPSGSSSGEGQSQLMSEAEQLKRQLQRLSRERSSPELNRVSRQLQQAIQEMKKSLDGQKRGEQGGAQGMRALERLEEARRAMSREQNSGLESGLAEAIDESKRLLDEQKRIQDGVDRLLEDRQRDTERFQRNREDLSERKELLADRLGGLEDQINDLARSSRRTQSETSSQLRDAAGTIRDNRLPQRVLSTNRMLESGYYDFLKGREEFIQRGLEELNRQLESAKGSIGQTAEGRLEDAVNRTRQLAEGLEAMERRLRDAKRGQRGDDAQQGSSQQKGAERQGRPGQQSSQQQGKPGQQRSQQQGQQSGKSGQSGQRGDTRTPQPGRPGDSAGNPTRGDVRDQVANSLFPPQGGAYMDENYRQRRREIKERLMDAQELRRLMDRNPTQRENLRDVIDRLRSLDDARDHNDPEEIARLKGAIELLRQIELDLSRDLAKLTNREKYLYAEDNEAPSSYRKLVEEYYKALARSKNPEK